MSEQYVVTTPKNPLYEGKAFGIRFTRGRALISPYTIDPLLGYTVEEVAERMKKDLGYTVEAINETPAAVLAAVPSPAEAVTAEEPSTKRGKRGGS